MITLYPVEVKELLPRTHPLYVGNFYKLSRTSWPQRKRRQAFVIALAQAWHRAIKKFPTAAGFAEKECFLTNLYKHGGNRQVIEKFFLIKKLGSKRNGESSPTIVTPKKLNIKIDETTELLELVYDPGPVPTGEHTISPVRVVTTQPTILTKKLKEAGRYDLIPIVNWLIDTKPEVLYFHFKPAGETQSRDTSVWPIKAIETWPGWLRKELFGTAIDLEAAWIQFIVGKLRSRHDKDRLALLYPTIIRLLETPAKFRKEICTAVGCESNKENLKKIKKLIMAVSNGSRLSTTMIINGSHNSDAVQTLRSLNRDLTATQAEAVGLLVGRLSKEIKRAKQELCLLYGMKATSANQKKIFSKYFEWEREARYKIWEEVGNTGLHLHDGIDGIEISETPHEVCDRIKKKHGLKVSIK